MGIPSYYKKLSEKIKGLITRSRPTKIEALFFDFNCLIYHCARRPNTTLPPYPGDEGKEEWENLLIQDIGKYIQYIWHEAGQPKEVFLSIDGVVPMAKIKQQRLRRFKSIWLSTQEAPEKPTWDTNCITPGTDFMKRLSFHLQSVCARHRGWRLSSDLEPGEGEHKIMHLLRTTKKREGTVAIYGLDADLILLTLLNSPNETYLMREDSEMGVVQTDVFGQESFSFFSLETLKKTIWSKPDVEYSEILEYVTAMSFLGNDFLPHSLSVKIREDGHSFLLSHLKALKEKNEPLIVQEEGLWKMNYSAVATLLRGWASAEEDKLTHSFKKKIQMRGHAVASEKSLETLPLENPVEFAVLFVENKVWQLKRGWQDVYRKQWLFCKDSSDLDKCCREYLIGLQWVLDYYTGQRQVDMTWYYPRLIPPLWCDLTRYVESHSIPEPQISTGKPIQPEEQLAMVLPLQSWHHLPQKSPLRSLPSLYPQFWPEEFSFFTAGRIRLWECEPLLPILPVQCIRTNSLEKD